MDKATMHVVLWCIVLGCINALVLEWDSERFKHHLRQLEPCIVHLDQISLFPQLPILYPQLLVVASNRFGHVLECLLSVSILLGFFLSLEYILDSSLSFFLVLFLLKFLPQHLYYMYVLFLFPFGSFFI